jgi:hypothetical protein
MTSDTLTGAGPGEDERCPVGLPPRSAHARAPPALQWRTCIARHRLALVAIGLVPIARVAATAATRLTRGARATRRKEITMRSVLLPLSPVIAMTLSLATPVAALTSSTVSKAGIPVAYAAIDISSCTVIGFGGCTGPGSLDSFPSCSRCRL